LELLDKAWCQLLAPHDHTLSFTLRTGLHIIWIVCTAASAMRTNCLSRVLYFHFFAIVEVFEADFDLDDHWRSSLFLLLPLTITCQSILVLTLQIHLRRSLRKRRMVNLRHHLLADPRTSLHIGRICVFSQSRRGLRMRLRCPRTLPVLPHLLGSCPDGTSNSSF